MTPIRVYADTSVFGGPFDAEFATPSRMFFDQVRMGRFRLVTSSLVVEEIAPAPSEVRGLFEAELPQTEVLLISPEAITLRASYIDAGVVGPSSAADAMHVSLATVSQCRLIVSWNFRHIIHFDKVARYNAVNVLRGFQPIGIHSPAEVVSYEKRV